MKLEFLADNQEALPVVAKWYFDQWGHLSRGNTLAKVTRSLGEYLNKDKITLIVLAVEAEEVMGAAQLKYREMDIYPEKEHWLGGVYVSRLHLGNNIAEQVIEKIVSVAKQLGVHKLYLQTPHLDGGLYNRLGWKPLNTVNHRGLDVLVMEKNLWE